VTKLNSRLTAAPVALALLALAALACFAAPPASAEPGPIATFEYTGGPQAFTVPNGDTYLTFDVIGGRGGYPNEGGAPGAGQRVWFQSDSAPSALPKG
jgi:hypothetical protein